MTTNWLASFFRYLNRSFRLICSDAVANEVPKQVETESHTLKGMLLNLSAARAAAIAADLEIMGREGKIAGMKEALTGFQGEAETLLLQMESVELQR